MVNFEVNGGYLFELFEEFVGLGLMGMIVLEEFGGVGVDYVFYVFVLMEIGVVDGVFFIIFFI